MPLMGISYSVAPSHCRRPGASRASLPLQCCGRCLTERTPVVGCELADMPEAQGRRFRRDSHFLAISVQQSLANGRQPAGLQERGRCQTEALAKGVLKGSFAHTCDLAEHRGGQFSPIGMLDALQTSADRPVPGAHWQPRFFKCVEVAQPRENERVENPFRVQDTAGASLIPDPAQRSANPIEQTEWRTKNLRP